MKKRVSGLSLAIIWLILVAGCQTAKITQSSVDSLAGLVAKTDPILVQNFDASKAVFKGDYSNVNVLNDADRQRISRIISQAMIDGLTQEGYAAKPFSADAPPGAVVVAGQVTQVDKGSYSKRLLIGMGSGSQSMAAHVRIHRTGTTDTVIAELELAGNGGFYGSSGGMWANEDWIGIYSASLGYKVAQFIAGKTTK